MEKQSWQIFNSWSPSSKPLLCVHRVGNLDIVFIVVKHRDPWTYQKKYFIRGQGQGRTKHWIFPSLLQKESWAVQTNKEQVGSWIIHQPPSVQQHATHATTALLWTSASCCSFWGASASHSGSIKASRNLPQESSRHCKAGQCELIYTILLELAVSAEPKIIPLYLPSTAQGVTE